MPPVDIDTKIDLLHARMSTMEATLGKVGDALVTIARLDERMQNNNGAMERAFAAVAAMDVRVSRLEEQQPVAKLISGWVLAWVTGIVGLVSGAVAVKVMGL